MSTGTGCRTSTPSPAITTAPTTRWPSGSWGWRFRRPAAGTDFHPADRFRASPDSGAQRLIRATVRYPVASPGKRSATGGEFNDSLSPIGNTAATLLTDSAPPRIAARSALAGLRSGIRLLAPVSAARPGGEFNDSLSPIGNTAATILTDFEPPRIAARSALAGLRSGIRLLAPVSAARPGESSMTACRPSVTLRLRY